MAKRKSKSSGTRPTPVIVDEPSGKEDSEQPYVLEQMEMFSGESHNTSQDVEPVETPIPAPTIDAQSVESSRYCSSCGVSVSGVDRFCAGCGHNLQGNMINISFESSTFTASYPGDTSDPEEIWKLIAPRISVAKVNFNMTDNGPTFHISCGLGTPPEASDG